MRWGLLLTALLALGGCAALDYTWGWYVVWPGTEQGWTNLFTALFVHSDWLHLVGNLAYLWVFGIPVEKRVGPILLALTLLVGGAMAHLVLMLLLPRDGRAATGRTI